MKISRPFWFSILLGILSTIIAPAATYTLGVQLTGDGSVSRNPNLGAYPEGSVVTLTATPGPGWQFSSWSGDTAGSANPINVTMNSNKTVGATFTPIPNYTLSIVAQGAGYVTPAGGTFASNTTVNLAATPSNGWVFGSWSGDISGTANPVTVNMNSNKSVVAVFGQPPVILWQPTNLLVLNPGSSGAFYMGATGTPAVSYQWYFNDAPVLNANQSSLGFTNVQTASAGDYYVVVANNYGSVTSQVGKLVVECSGPQVVTVCSDADLRQAVEDGGYVRFCCNGTIVLTNTISVLKSVTLDGSGQKVTIDGNSAFRLFHVGTGAVLRITNVALVNGRASSSSTPPAEGGAIYNFGGSVILDSCVLSNNVVTGLNVPNGRGGDAAGGAIRSVPTPGTIVEFSRCLVLSNSAVGGPGLTNGSAFGGAIRVTGSLRINDSTLVGNHTFAGIGMWPAESFGGAIYTDGVVTISNSVLSANVARTGSDISGSASSATVAGGALYAHIHVPTLSGDVKLDAVRFLNNSADGGYARNGMASSASGGAIYNWCSLEARACTISLNQATGGGGAGPGKAFGGGLFNHDFAVARLDSVTISSNAAVGGFGRGTAGGSFAGAGAFGGGIYTRGSLAVTNTTIAANISRGGNPGGPDTSPGLALGGGMFQDAPGAGVESALVHATLASNLVQRIAYSGANMAAAGANLAVTNGVLSLRSSLLAASSNNVWGTVTDVGYNMSSDGSANFSSGTSFNFTNPRLGPLAWNGGITKTMALLPGSPAIDFGGNSGFPVTDQRGVPRSFGSAADIGAFEVGPAVPALSLNWQPEGAVISFFAQAGIHYRIEQSTNLQDWLPLVTVGPLPTDRSIQRTNSNAGTMQFFRLALDY